jgi:hypothetical protein
MDDDKKGFEAIYHFIRVSMRFKMRNTLIDGHKKWPIRFLQSISSTNNEIKRMSSSSEIIMFIVVPSVLLILSISSALAFFPQAYVVFDDNFLS